MLRNYILTILFFAVVFGILIFVCEKCSLKKSKRPMHVFSVVVMIVLVVAASLFMPEIINLIDDFLQLDFMRSAASFVFGSVPAVSLTGITLAILILNIMFLIAGVIVRLLCKAVLSGIRIPEGERNPFAVIIRRFYDTESGCFTQPNAYVIQKWLSWAKISVIALFALMSVALITLCFFYPGQSGTDARLVADYIIYLYWFPIASYLIINEFCGFLSGYSLDDDNYDFETEDISSRIVGDYAKMVSVYKETAGDANLIKVYCYESTAGKDFFNGGKTTQTSRCKPEMAPVYEMIENNIRLSGVDICDEYADGLVTLLNGGDVFFADSITGEISQYIFNYLNYQLCCGHKIIVLCRNDIYSDLNQRELYIGMLKKNLENINGYGEIWKVGTIDNILNNEHIDVLLSSFCTYIYDYSRRANSKFFERVSICVCADCLELFSDEQFYKKAVVSHFEHTIDDVQYIFLSESNSVSLKNAVIDTVGEKHHIEYYRNSNWLNDAYIFLWKGESYYKPQMIFDSDSKYYYGSALPLGVIAAKYGVEKVNILNCENTPYRTYHRMMRDRSAEIEKAVGSSVNFDELFSYEYVNYYLSEDLVFLIVYDKYNNAAVCKDVWGRISDNKTTIVHIISEPYMLREFLCDNIEDVQIAEAIVPFNDKIYRAGEAKTLIINMFEFGVKLSDIRSLRKMIAGELSDASVSDILKEIFALAFPDEPKNNCLSYFSLEDDIRFDKAENKYDCERVVWFINKNLFEKLISKEKYAKIILNNYDGFRYLPVLASDISNYYLEDQYISIDGESVRITSISGGELTAKLTSETNHYEYVPVYSFSGRNFELINDDNSEDALYYLRYGTADVTRKVSDYYSLLQGRNLTNSANCSKYHMSASVEQTDSIRGVQTLIISFNYPFADNVKAAALMAELLNGLFRTLFPTLYQNIVACANTRGLDLTPAADDDPGEEIRQDVSAPDMSAMEKIAEMIPCDSSIPEKACAVTVYEFCHKEMGLVYELKTRFNEILILLQRYLDWEITHSGGRDSYLKYGFGTYPSVFPVYEVKDYLDRVIPRNISKSSYNSDVRLNGWTHCEYCLKPIILKGRKLNDGRLMCNECFKHRIGAKDEIENLFGEVVRFMNRHYDIEVVRKTHDGALTISVRFKSRKTINSAIENKSPFSVVLGFYNHEKRQLWVERGGPSPAIYAVLAHELTHAWQKDMFDMEPPASLLRKGVQIDGISKPVDIEKIHIWEGHATYVEIEVMRLVNQHEYADHLEKEILGRSDDDDYKIGYLYMIQLLKNSASDNIFEFLMKEGARKG